MFGGSTLIPCCWKAKSTCSWPWPCVGRRTRVLQCRRHGHEEHWAQRWIRHRQRRTNARACPPYGKSARVAQRFQGERRMAGQSAGDRHRRTANHRACGYESAACPAPRCARLPDAGRWHRLAAHAAGARQPARWFGRDFTSGADDLLGFFVRTGNAGGRRPKHARARHEISEPCVAALADASQGFPQHVHGYLQGAVGAIAKHGGLAFGPSLADALEAGDRARADYYDTRLSMLGDQDAMLAVIETMLETGRASLRRSEAVEAVDKALFDGEDAVREAIKHGVLTLQKGGLSFGIPSFRDHMKNEHRQRRSVTPLRRPNRD